MPGHVLLFEDWANAAGAFRFIPVSYTHLDVYKRQSKGAPFFWPFAGLWLARFDVAGGGRFRSLAGSL